MLSASRDNTLRIYDDTNFGPVHQLQHPDYRSHVAWSKSSFSPDGRFVAAGSGNGKVCIWGTAKGDMHSVLAAHTGGVSCCAWDPLTARLASVDKKGTLIIWQ